MSTLHPYMAWAGDPGDGALLVFAHTAREARRLACGDLGMWTGCEFIDVRTLRLRKHATYLQTLRQSDKPHVIDDLPTCQSCDTWGAPLTATGCETCDARRDE